MIPSSWQTAAKSEITVAHLCDFYARPGGLARAVQVLARSLSHNHVKCLVFVPGRRIKVLYDRQTQVFVMPSLSHILQPYRRVRYVLPICDPLFLLFVLVHLRKSNLDVIHAHGWVVYTAYWLKLLKRTPLFYSAHDYGTFCIKRSLYQSESNSLCPKIDLPTLGTPNRRCLSCARDLPAIRRGFLVLLLRLQKPMLGYLDGTFVMSNSMEEILESIGNHNLIRIITPSNRGELNLPEVPALSVPYDLVYFGALSKYKGAELFIQAIQLLRKGGFKYSVCMIGSAGDLDLRSQTGINFIVDAPRATISAVLASAKCVVFPPRWLEPAIPLTILECLSINQSVLVSNRGGTADVTKYGIPSFKSGDAYSLMNEIVNIIEGGKKPMSVQSEISSDCEQAAQTMQLIYGKCNLVRNRLKPPGFQVNATT